MSSRSAEWHLLFGLLALQNGVISRQQLVTAFAKWTSDKSLPLDQILVADQAINASHCETLKQLVELHIQHHGGDPQKSLLALSGSDLPDARADLARLDDAELHQTIALVPDRDAATTIPHSMGQSTSSGTRFRVLRPLPGGEGGMGKISVAADEELGRQVALKQIRSDKADDEFFRKKFQVEAEITGNLEHPGIVPVYGLGKAADGRPYYAMRLVYGDNLSARIKQFHNGTKFLDYTSVEFHALIDRLLDVAQAIRYAHSRGVLHRDLKPGNILVGEYGETLVIDWGLARLPHTEEARQTAIEEGIDGKAPLNVRSGSEVDKTIQGGQLGTVGYAPPEQMNGRVDLISERSDVYGLGAILYEILTGRPPIDRKGQDRDLGASIRDVIEGNITPPRQVNRSIPKSLAAICLKALQREPADRYASVAAFIADVERWKADQPVSAAPESLVDRARRLIRRHRSAALTAAATLLVITVVGSIAGRLVLARARAASLVEQLMTAKEDSVGATVEQLQAYLSWARPDLERLAQRKSNTAQEEVERMHARLALVPSDDSQVAGLLESLLTATPKYVDVLRDALRPRAGTVAPTLWKELQNKEVSSERRFRAAMALAGYAPNAETWREEDFQFVCDHLLSENPRDQPDWLRLLSPVGDCCLPRLEEWFARSDATETQQLGAANAIAVFAKSDQKLLARLLTIATAKQYEILFELVGQTPKETVKSDLARLAAELPPDDMGSVERVAFGQRRAGAGITLLRLGEREKVLPTFDLTDDPEAMTQFIHRGKDRGVRTEELLALLRLVSSPPLPPSSGGEGRGQGVKQDRFGDSSHARYALLLALGEYSIDDIPAADRDQLLGEIADWYAHDPSSAVHGASGWLLRQWKQDEVLRRVDETAVDYAPDREWFTLAIEVKPPGREDTVADSGTAGESAEEDTSTTNSNAPGESGGDENSEGAGRENAASSIAEKENPDESNEQAREQHDKTTSPNEDEPAGRPEPRPQTLYLTFVVFQPGEYELGCPLDEEGRFGLDFAPYCVTITRPFAVLDREVTWEWFNATGSWQHAAWEKQFNRELTPEMPAFGINWYEAVGYCRWLTEQAGMKAEDQCYASPADLAKDKDGYPENWPVDLDKSGFRLLTEAEWEVVCRAGMRPAYSFGGDTGWLNRYAYFGNPQGWSHPVAGLRPNPRGLFGIHGNLYEWCQDWHGADYTVRVTDATGPETGSRRVNRGGGWVGDAAYCRSANRGNSDPAYRGTGMGFRPALSPSSESGQVGEEASEGSSIGRDGSPTDREP